MKGVALVVFEQPNLPPCDLEEARRDMHVSINSDRSKYFGNGSVGIEPAQRYHGCGSRET